ncbi:MAG: ATP-binding protein [Cuspidothrix sp.]
MHLKIGQVLFKNSNSLQLEENIFEIVNQLNMGIEIINDQREKYELAKLNLMAGCKAKSSTAYEAAARYLNVGLELLAADSWEYEYELTLNLYVESVEAAHLNINLDQAITYIGIVNKNAANVLDKVKVYKKQMLMYDMELSIDTGIKLIEMLGVTLEQVPPKSVNIEDLMYLPEMIDPYKLAAMGILMSLSLVAYISNPALVLPIIFTMIHLSIHYGNSSDSAYGYVVYGFLLCDAFSDIETGYRYGKLAFNLSEQFDSKVIKFRASMLWYSNINYRKHHFRESIVPLQEMAYYGWEIGETDFLGSCFTAHVFKVFFAGENLIELSQSFAHYITIISQRKLDWHIQNLKIWQQLIFNLIEVNHDKCQFNGDFVTEKLFLSFVKTKNYNSLFGFYLTKTIQFYLFRKYKQAVDSGISAKQYILAVPGQVIVSEHNFYYSLALLADYPYQPENKKLEYMKDILANQEKMNIWAFHAPMNYQHKYDLIEAEKAKVLGNNWQAMELYDKAIAGAKENKYIQEEALANELAARFYLNHHKEKIAKTYLIDAYYCYANWGAKSKTEDLELTYYQLLEPIINQRKTKLTEGEVSTLISKPSLTGVSALLDLETVTKASLAISSEIQIDKLLKTLMQVILENVAANKSVLILQKEGDLTLVAQCINEYECELHTTPINNSENLPLTIVNYVVHTKEYLLISDATHTHDFLHDSYIIKYQPKSILCTPILNKGELIAILYLENNLTVGAFTANRLRILNLLASQAAISLENAQLYKNLEEKVSQRTQELNEKNLRLEAAMYELRTTQSQLIQTEKMSSLGQMVAGIAHEINNPVNFIYANIEHASNYIEFIINLFQIYQQEYPNPSSIIQKYKKDNEFDFIIEDLPKILDSMMVGSERIRKIVLGLRNFSRLDESAMKPVDIHEGLDSTLMILQPRFHEKLGYSTNVVIKNYGDIPLIQCYASQMNQVFMNIISNAIDVLKEREEKLPKTERKSNSSKIIIGTQAINSEWIQIRIKDNGMGINPEIRERIFDPFFTTKPVGEGTGLGLSISYQIVVDKHGGKLDCISEPDQGTEFIIEIPTTLYQSPA